MAKAFALKVDIGRLEGFADRLGALTGDEFGLAAMGAVNQVLDNTYERARPLMIRTINLTDDYVRDRMRVEHATNPNNISGAIIASGARSNITTLARYNPQQGVRPVNWSNDRILAMGKKFAPYPGWTKRKGDARTGQGAGIAPNMKAAGISVEVTRGASKPISNAFYMPLRNGNGLGVFTREGKGKKNYKHRYGPSVYQMFARVADSIINDVGDDLESAVIDEANRLLDKALK